MECYGSWACVCVSVLESVCVFVCIHSCKCCAFSAVPSSIGHSPPSEACRENVSHGVIMTNPPPHTQHNSLPGLLFPLVHPPFYDRLVLHLSPSVFPQSEAGTCAVSVSVWVVEPRWDRRHMGTCDQPQLLIWSCSCQLTLPCLPQPLPCFSYSCRRVFWFAWHPAVCEFVFSIH